MKAYGFPVLMLEKLMDELCMYCIHTHIIRLAWFRVVYLCRLKPSIKARSAGNGLRSRVCVRVSPAQICNNVAFKS